MDHLEETFKFLEKYHLPRLNQEEIENMNRSVTVKFSNRDLTGGQVVKSLPCNAGDVGSVPGWGTKIPHAAEHLSPCATATELVLSRAHVPQLESFHATTTEAHKLCRPGTATTEPTHHN